MQSKDKGFSLIELLAVIVILAIIALIAVPVIMNVIENARKSAFEDSVYGIIEAAELYYSNQLLEPNDMKEDKEFTITNGGFVGEALEVSGNLPSSGKVTVTKEGKVAVVLTNGEYYVQKATSESEIKAQSLKKDNITEEEIDYKKVSNPVFTKATGETSVPACITNNTACNVAAASNDGIKVGVKVNNTDNPLDFYVISEDTNKGTITLIMDRNLDDLVSWSDSGDNSTGPVTALNYLESQTTSWTNIPSATYILTDDNSTPKYTEMTRTARARMITHTETKELGCKDSNSSTCPTWLYKNSNSSSAPFGYWISSAYVDDFNRAWCVYYLGSTNLSGVNNDNYFGVRPVITISKNVIQ